MALIFVLSAQPDLSSGLGILDLVGRKIVHAALYGLLCWLWARALATRLSGARAVACALAVSVLYAVSDEYHQTFVAGRAGSSLDVAIDTAGALVVASLLRRPTRGERGRSRSRREPRPHRRA
jgi:VanZ family protein